MTTLIDPETDHALRVPCQQAPDIWFSNLATERDLARHFCDQCPLQQACITAALDLEEGAAVQHRHGIWGGLDPVQRRKLAETLGRTQNHPPQEGPTP